jgi:long-chain acyl-CoA synthetase
MGAKPGDGIIGCLPLSTTFGFGSVVVAGYGLGSEIALLERFDPRVVIDLFATRRYEYFPAAPVMVDLLGRCPLVGAPPPAPRLTRVVGGVLRTPHYEAFLARFGGPPRPAYGSTECLAVAGESRPVDRIRPDGVGPPYDGIEVRIGAVDTWQAGPGETRGRVWVRSPFLADGYGYPPDVEPFPVVDGWWGASDGGYFDDEGCLVLTGRIDESFKTPAGHLVSPSEITGALLQCPGVVDAAVLPLPRSHGAAVGAVVAGTGLDLDTVRGQVSRLLPPSAQPEVLRVVPEIPRTAHGKLSRDACLAILQAAPAPDTSIR